MIDVVIQAGSDAAVVPCPAVNTGFWLTLIMMKVKVAITIQFTKSGSFLSHVLYKSTYIIYCSISLQDTSVPSPCLPSPDPCEGSVDAGLEPRHLTGEGGEQTQQPEDLLALLVPAQALEVVYRENSLHGEAAPDLSPASTIISH